MEPPAPQPEIVLYAELTPAEFQTRRAAAPIAYLPLGTLEYHGAHLPLGADGLQSAGFFEQLARRAGGIVLPMLFLGPDRQQRLADGRELYGMDISRTSVPARAYPDQQLPGSAYWVPDATFETLLDAILKQLARVGFRIVVGHGHAPSARGFMDRAAQWRERYGLRCFHCWNEPPWEDLGLQVDHAGRNETSVVMALRPELAQLTNLPADPAVWPVAVGGRDPRTEASAEHGRQVIATQVERMAGVLQQALAEIRSA